MKLEMEMEKDRDKGISKIPRKGKRVLLMFEGKNDGWKSKADDGSHTGGYGCLF